MQLNHLSLFSGGGGGDLACKWAGFETLAFVEKDEYCQKLLAKNYPGIPIHGDIFEFTGEPFRGVTLLTGGFPCQPFSQAGKRKGAADDRYLWPEMLRVIREAEPAWVIGENVGGLVNMLEFEDVCASLEATGYSVQPLVLPACAVDAPHRRERVFVVGRAGPGPQPLANAQRSGSLEGRTQIDSTEVGELAQRRPSERGEDVADPSSVRLTGQRQSFDARDPTKDRERQAGQSQHVRIGGEWQSEPSVGRVANGVADRMDRLRVLGNSIVPQQWYPIIQGIADIESGLIK